MKLELNDTFKYLRTENFIVLFNLIDGLKETKAITVLRTHQHIEVSTPNEWTVRIYHRNNTIRLVTTQYDWHNENSTQHEI